MTESVALFKLLGDETRYKLVCALYRSDSYVELLAEQLGLTPGTVCFHLKKLEAAGIVNCSRSQFYIIYSLNKAIFTRRLDSFLELGTTEDPEEAYRRKVIASFFSGERLISIPVQEKKRRIVLAKIMEDFPEASYDEKEVDRIITRRFDDFCTLRRWLIADGFMSREHEKYEVLCRT